MNFTFKHPFAVLIFFVLFINNAFLFASPSEVSSVLKPFKTASYAFRIGNDRWSNGISYNMDDQKTYSLGLGVDFGKFSVDLDAESYTDKEKNTRYDLLLLNFSLPLSSTEYTDIIPRIGIGIYGNIGLQGAQNLLHKLMGIYQLDLNYPDKTHFYPIIALDIEAHYNFGKFKLSLYSQLEYKILFSADEEVGLKGRFEDLGLFAGYRFMQKSNINDITLADWIKHREGLQIGYEIEKGVLSANYFTNPLTRQGYGDIKISVLKPYIETEIKYTFGKVWYVFFQNRDKAIIENFNLIELCYKNIFLQTQFNTGIDGEPMDNGIFSIGYNYSFFKNFGIKPSLKYARFTINGTDNSLNFFGFGLELNCGMVLYAHYQINLILGALYFVGREFAPNFGVNITLI